MISSNLRPVKLRFLAPNYTFKANAVNANCNCNAWTYGSQSIFSNPISHGGNLKFAYLLYGFENG